MIAAALQLVGVTLSDAELQAMSQMAIFLVGYYVGCWIAERFS